MKKKNNILTIIKKEFARFFGDRKMAFTTLLLPGLMIYVMYSFMGQAIAKQFMPDESVKPVAYIYNMPAFLDETANKLFDLKPTDGVSIDEAKAAVETKSAKLVAVFPADFSDAVAAFDVTNSTSAAPNVAVYYNSTNTDSSAAYSTLSAALSAYEDTLSNKFDVNAGGDAYDLASEKDMTAQIFSSMVPMLMMIFLFSGCMAVAPESIAGEKERGTIATLLVTPLKRSELAIGKIISLSAIALLSGISSFLGTMLSMPKLMGVGAPNMMNASTYTSTDYAMLLGIVLSTVLIIISAISIISALSKSVKEASSAIMPLMILVMFIGISGMFSDGAATNLLLYFVPLYNSVQCMSGIFSFTYQPVQIFVTLASNVFYAVILILLLTKMFNSEKVMFAK